MTPYSCCVETEKQQVDPQGFAGLIKHSLDQLSTVASIASHTQSYWFQLGTLGFTLEHHYQNLWCKVNEDKK